MWCYLLFWECNSGVQKSMKTQTHLEWAEVEYIFIFGWTFPLNRLGFGSLEHIRVLKTKQLKSPTKHGSAHVEPKVSNFCKFYFVSGLMLIKSFTRLKLNTVCCVKELHIQRPSVKQFLSRTRHYFAKTWITFTGWILNTAAAPSASLWRWDDTRFKILWEYFMLQSVSTWMYLLTTSINPEPNRSPY